jgi:hypothetical protein
LIRRVKHIHSYNQTIRGSMADKLKFEIIFRMLVHIWCIPDPEKWWRWSWRVCHKCINLGWDWGQHILSKTTGDKSESSLIFLLQQTDNVCARSINPFPMCVLCCTRADASYLKARTF